MLVFHAGVEEGGVYLGPKLPGETGAREASVTSEGRGGERES